MNKDSLLLIFVKNPELGKVKTRLAQHVGESQALDIYQALLRHTAEISGPLACDKAVFYSDAIDVDDIWKNDQFYKLQQKGNDLGNRMHHAFQWAFEQGYQRVVIIGSDCIELTTAIIKQSFNLLQTNEVVIGPARDGGYYLLGMRIFLTELFQNKLWSTSQVLTQTIADLAHLTVSYAQLATLSDIDEFSDIEQLSPALRNKLL